MKLTDNETVEGVVEYYDQRFIRITRTGRAESFIFKHEIKYLYEEPFAAHVLIPRRRGRRSRTMPDLCSGGISISTFVLN